MRKLFNRFYTPSRCLVKGFALSHFCFICLSLCFCFGICASFWGHAQFIFTVDSRDAAISIALSDKRQMRTFVIWTTS